MRGFHEPSATRQRTELGSSNGDATHRLTLQGGRWILETSRLVALDRDVMRQEHQQIVGVEAVLEHLRRIDHSKRLAQGAAELMRSSHDSEPSCFEAFEGAWFPIENPVGRARERSVSNSELKELLAELRAELLVLRASHQRLRRRVAQLETVRHLGPARERESQRQAQPEARSVRLEQHAAPSRAAAQLEPLPQAAERTRTPATVASAEAPAAEAPAAEPGPMGLPPRLELVQCIQSLLGTKADFAAKSQELPEPSQALFVSVFFDDTRAEVGCVLLDARGVAEFGGSLLGVPGPAIEEQAKSGTPSEDCLSAASEVCNNLSGVVNRAGCHVTAGALLPHTEAGLPWLANWSKRFVVLSTEGGGCLWLLAR